MRNALQTQCLLAKWRQNGYNDRDGFLTAARRAWRARGGSRTGRRVMKFLTDTYGSQIDRGFASKFVKEKLS